jgi:hypothetical protein
MLNSSYPYMQASGNQIADTFQTFADAYTTVTIILAAMLLVLLTWFSISELRQSKPVARTARRPRPDQPQHPLGRRPTRRRDFIEESSI